MSYSKAEEIAVALGGCRCGDQWLARCPAHDDHQPSLSIKETDDGRILFHCFAGCDYGAIRQALARKGIVIGSSMSLKPLGLQPAKPMLRRLADSSGDTQASVACIIRSSRPAMGTPVESYLAGRGITDAIPASIRFVPHLSHGCSGKRLPAMVGLVTKANVDGPVAVHRTYLQPGGSGKACVDPNRMMLGRCAGGAVALAAAQECIAVGEGIETCLSFMQATGLPTWAALSTAGLVRLVLPPGVKEVVIAADGDESGEKAAHEAAERWVKEGRKVRIARPPRGKDFNDLLLAAGLTDGSCEVA